MKLHYKDWVTVVFRKAGKQSFRIRKAVEGILADSTPKEWGDIEESTPKLLAIERPYRCFRFAGDRDEVNDYFEDLIHPVVRKSNSNFVTYPVYCDEIQLRSVTFGILCFPYSDLGEDIMRHFGSIEYCRIAISELMALMHDQLYGKKPARTGVDSPAAGRIPSERSILRSGRFPLEIEKANTSSLPKVNARTSNGSGVEKRDQDCIENVVLVGKDVMMSSLYRRLVSGEADGHKYVFSGSVARVSYFGESGSMVSTRIDRRGNYAFRPGTLGNNIKGLKRFFEFCDRNNLIEIGRFSPFDHPIEIAS